MIVQQLKNIRLEACCAHRLSKHMSKIVSRRNKTRAFQVSMVWIASTFLLPSGVQLTSGLAGIRWLLPRLGLSPGSNYDPPGPVFRTGMHLTPS